MKLKKFFVMMVAIFVLFSVQNVVVYANSETVSNTAEINTLVLFDSGYDESGFYYEAFYNPNDVVLRRGVLHYVNVSIAVSYGIHPFNSFTIPSTYYYKGSGLQGMVGGVTYDGTLNLVSSTQMLVGDGLYSVSARYEGTVVGFIP